MCLIRSELTMSSALIGIFCSMQRGTCVLCVLIMAFLGMHNSALAVEGNLHRPRRLIEGQYDQLQMINAASSSSSYYRLQLTRRSVYNSSPAPHHQPGVNIMDIKNAALFQTTAVQRSRHRARQIIAGRRDVALSSSSSSSALSPNPLNSDASAPCSDNTATSIGAANIDQQLLPPPSLQTLARVGGFANADFFITLAIGTPPVNFSALIDTGSDLVWRQCLPCTSCFHQSPPIFDPSFSVSYSPASCLDPLCSYARLLGPTIPCSVDPDDAGAAAESASNCHYIYGYGTNSTTTSGELAHDVLFLPGAAGELQLVGNFAFGCGHEQGSFDIDDSDGLSGFEGIVGFSKGPLSLPSQLGVTQFSYCLNSFDGSTTTSDLNDQSEQPAISAGTLFLGPLPSTVVKDILAGGNAASITTPSLQYVGTEPGSNLFRINLVGISVGGLMLDVPADTFALQQKNGSAGGLVVDSGTSITLLPELAYAKLLNVTEASLRPALPVSREEAASATGFDLCYQPSAFLDLRIPSLIFHLEGGNLMFPKENFFVDINDLTCLAMASSQSPSSILGNIQQQNFLVNFDNAAATLTFTGPTYACDFL